VVDYLTNTIDIYFNSMPMESTAPVVYLVIKNAAATSF
jgi:hypothetical protein